jgi:Leucine-rich repeat (LRR) protein
MHFKVMRGQANTISFQTAELAPGIKGSLMAIMELLAVQTIPLSPSNYVSISIEWNIVSSFGPLLISFSFLAANNLVGSIPREIGYYTNLIDLDLSDNLIGGSIASLVNLTHLGTLNCSLNSLTGTLPEFLFTHRSLTDIDFDQNHFFGSISDSLGNSDQLRVFWAQNNSLTGTIPSAVGQSWVLGSIDVNSNQLTGTIPDFTPSSRIWDLHLANNMVTGMIPTTIGSLSSLRNLGLYGNWLTGTIPTELGKCRNIIYVDFDDNSLTGDVGPLIDSFSPSLEGLDASRNLLEGTIPISVGTLTKLSFLDLLENQVGGTLPSELGLLNQLEVLNIAYNEFTGSVPSTLANLSNLGKYTCSFFQFS